MTEPQAANCIQDIEESGVLWKSSQWLSWQHQYPPQLGIRNDLTFSIQSELVGDYHEFGYVKKTLTKQNIYPVSTDSLKSDGKMLPPANC
jgi:hypothetical protein